MATCDKVKFQFCTGFVQCSEALSTHKDALGLVPVELAGLSEYSGTLFNTTEVDVQP